MTQVLVHPDSDGRVIITIPSPDFSVDDVREAAVPQGVPCFVSSFEELENKDFRYAWKFNPDGIHIDMEIAREVHRERIRAARIEAFRTADRDFMLALESGDEAARAEVVARKVALRDLPSATEIMSAESLTDLRSFWPVDLLGPSPYGVTS